MDFFDAIQASSSGLSAQRLRMNLISGNLANVNTTRTREGGPYRRREAIFAARSGVESFKNIMADRQRKQLSMVAVDRITEIVGSDEYAYLVRTGALEIRSMKTGALTGTIGAVTYDE